MTLQTPESRTGSTSPTVDREALLDWWSHVPTGRRRQLTTLSEGEPLPRTVAADLARLGFACPLVLVPEDGRLVRRSLAPAVLRDLLDQESGASAVTG